MYLHIQPHPSVRHKKTSHFINVSNLTYFSSSFLYPSANLFGRIINKRKSDFETECAKLKEQKEPKNEVCKK